MIFDLQGHIYPIHVQKYRFQRATMNFSGTCPCRTKVAGHSNGLRPARMPGKLPNKVARQPCRARIGKMDL